MANSVIQYTLYYHQFSYPSSVFSPSDGNWSVSNIMNEEYMKNKAQYTKLVSDCLTVREKEYQMMMESTVPATEGLTGGEEQVELLKQQLKQKEEVMIIRYTDCRLLPVRLSCYT